MNGRFFLRSRQTRLTPEVRAFAKSLVGSIRTPADFDVVFRGVQDRLDFLGSDELSRVHSVNSEVNRRLLDVLDGSFQWPGGEAIHRDNALHASLGGVRSAHQILKDGFVSRKYPCEDRYVLIMAVLRHHGVPCRLVHLLNPERKKQTCLVEAKLGGQFYVIKNIPRRESRVSQGLVRRGFPLDWITAHRIFKDHWDSGLDERKLWVHTKFSNLDATQIFQQSTSE